MEIGKCYKSRLFFFIEEPSYHDTTDRTPLIRASHAEFQSTQRAQGNSQKLIRDPLGFPKVFLVNGKESAALLAQSRGSTS